LCYWGKLAKATSSFQNEVRERREEKSGQWSLRGTRFGGKELEKDREGKTLIEGGKGLCRPEKPKGRVGFGPNSTAPEWSGGVAERKEVGVTKKASLMRRLISE